jgi:flagellar biosynthetic protein FliR
VVPISPDWLIHITEVLMLVSLRLLGLFLVMPLFAFRAVPMRLRVVLALLLAFGLAPLVNRQAVPAEAMAPGYLMVFIELGIGMAAGFLVRVGLMAVDVLSEMLSIQSGLSFAVSYTHDPSLNSGLMAEFLGLLSLALAFVLNIHLLVLDVLMQSFRVLPFGVWPAAWQWNSLVALISQAFVLGLVLSLPAIAVYGLFNMTQSVLARVSPQMNLFSIGFSVMIPVAFAVLAFMLPLFPDLLLRALEEPMLLLRRGLETAVPR